MNHLISLQNAIDLTQRFRKQRDETQLGEIISLRSLPISETFDRASFDTLLAQEGCQGVRIYYGMDEQNQVHAILVGVGAGNEDLLPTISNVTASTDDPIIEMGQRCPPLCPPTSPLN